MCGMAASVLVKDCTADARSARKRELPMSVQISFVPGKHGVFLERLNRFVALVRVDGKDVRAHIATSGRLGELLVPGAAVRLEPSRSTLRKTAFSLRVVEYKGVWVSIDAQVPNKLIRKALADRILQPFQALEFVRSEPAYKNGRFDFLLREQTGRPVYLEVKSVTLVEQECGLFPDAPTERGRRHLRHLADLARAGERCAVIFVVQRHDAEWFRPNYRTDPAFAEALRQAVSCGVEVYAYRCRVLPAGITLRERLPVLV